jgi:hypothetical protein
MKGHFSRPLFVGGKGDIPKLLAAAEVCNVIHIGQLIGRRNHAFKDGSPHRNQIGLKIQESIIGTSPVNNEGRRPQLSGIGLVRAIIEMFIEGMNLIRWQLAQPLCEQLAFGIHVSFGRLMNTVNDIPEFISGHVQ